MNVYIMTDMEGVAGVRNFEDYIYPDSRYYEAGRRLATAEASAAVEGCLAAGADEVMVVDGHGGGAIDPELLHPAATLLTGSPIGYPFGCDATFDCALIIGQHARAGTPDGHLWHTQSLEVRDFTINGISLGELGTNMLFCAYFQVPCVMVSGDAACCREARQLVADIETAEVKRGLNRGAAIHLHPQQARERIREAARRGVQRREEIGLFWIQPPYSAVYEFTAGADGLPPRCSTSAGGDLIEVLNGFSG